MAVHVGALMPPRCQRCSSAPRSYTLSLLTKPSCIVSRCQQRAVKEWWASIHFDWRTMLHNGPVLHTGMASQKRDHSTMAALWKGARMKRELDVSIRTVKSLQMRAQRDDALKKQCVSVILTCSLKSLCATLYKPAQVMIFKCFSNQVWEGHYLADSFLSITEANLSFTGCELEITSCIHHNDLQYHVNVNKTGSYFENAGKNFTATLNCNSNSYNDVK